MRDHSLLWAFPISVFFCGPLQSVMCFLRPIVIALGYALGFALGYYALGYTQGYAQGYICFLPLFELYAQGHML